MEDGILLAFSYGTSQVKADILRKERAITPGTSLAGVLATCVDIPNHPKLQDLKQQAFILISCVCWSTSQASLVAALQAVGVTWLSFSLYTGLRSPSWRAVLRSEIRRQM